MAFEMMENGESGALIKVIGVGGAGGNVINNMIRKQVKGNVVFIAANTDRQALSQSEAEVQIQLGHTGLGAGSKPEVGQQAANEAREEIADALRGANMVFITAGMGGGTGTGAASIVAEVAQELGILTVAVVTKPFSFEGNRRMRNAEAGIKALKARVHSLIIILNDKLEMELGEDATIGECFARADEVLYNAVAGISEIIQAPGLVNADFEDVRTVMSERGTAMMGSAEAEGQDRALQAASQAISCPLLEEFDVKGARGVLVNISGSQAVKMSEIRMAMETVRNFADPDANIVFGSVYDDSLGDKIRVTVIATGLDQDSIDPSYTIPTPQPTAAPQNQAAGLWKPQAHTDPIPPAAMGVDLFGQPEKPAKPVKEPQPVVQETSVNPFEIRNPTGFSNPLKQQPSAPFSTPEIRESVQQPAPVQVEEIAEVRVNVMPEPKQVVQPIQQPAAAPQSNAPSFVSQFSQTQASASQPVQPEPQVQRAAEPRPPQHPQPDQGAHSPFGAAGAFSRPIAQPDDSFQVPPARKDNTIFGMMNSGMGFNQGGFASLNPRNGQGSGLWSNNASVSNTAEQAQQEEEKPQFEHEIPAFLRKKN
ncbi:MAG: cell division protein FtsZ [Turicimonas muris]